MLEHRRKDLPTWVDFIRLMSYNVPLDTVAGSEAERSVWRDAIADEVFGRILSMRYKNFDINRVKRRMVEYMNLEKIDEVI